MTTISIQEEYFEEAFQEALRRYPDSLECLGFLHAVLGPLAPITEEDIAWANAEIAKLKEGK